MTTDFRIQKPRNGKAVVQAVSQSAQDWTNDNIILSKVSHEWPIPAECIEEFRQSLAEEGFAVEVL